MESTKSKKVTDPKVLAYLAGRDRCIRAEAKYTSIADLAETYELTEEAIQYIIENCKLKPKRKRINLEKSCPASIEKLCDKIKAMRLRGFSFKYMADILNMRMKDVKGIVTEFGFPYGIRCEDCDCQIILDKVKTCKRFCSKCAKVRMLIRKERWRREKYKNDPKFREVYIERSRKRSKQAKILG
jgi:hypothetical protein